MIPGIHHVTAIASDPQQNVDFYVGVLGLRLVKKTVNFDDPGTYHLYYGDATGAPGTLLTFFPWVGANPGRHGIGEATATALAVPRGTLNHWHERLAAHQIRVTGPETRFGEAYLRFADPDGLVLELVERDFADVTNTKDTTDTAIRGLDVITLMVANREPTERLLVDTLGFHLIAEEGPRLRFASNAHTGFVDLLAEPAVEHTGIGAGIMHHIAWRTPDDASQLAWRKKLVAEGYGVSPVMDRQYFHSIYFREPGGVLFEIATDPPGFATDESIETLGTRLSLPEQYEKHRAQLERTLVPLTVPNVPAV